MNKKAFNPDWLKLLIPTYSFLGNPDVAEGLPTLSTNKRHNMIMWNTLGSIAVLGTAGAAIKALAAETQNERWERKQKEALESKVNSITPIVIPDKDVTDEDKKNRLAIRSKGIDTPINKEAASIKEVIADTVGGLLPVGAGLSALYAGNKVVDKLYTKKRAEDLDKEIAEYEAELESLHSRMLDMQLANNKKGIDTADEFDIYKTASDGHWDRVGNVIDKIRSIGGLLDTTDTEGKQSLQQLLVKYPILSSLLIAVPATIGGYAFFSKRDEDSKKFSTMQDMAATNMTNVAPRLSLTLDSEGNPVVKSRTEEV